ncbi:hypothetical protein [Sediminibacillus terrae]|uniref:hypothetical protein n=1 Tax=Sediminibacillus terrae TaxID=1562106 RepID=UPI001294A506|nr:hypothetical protein [Sediminibacillus terrae]
MQIIMLIVSSITFVFFGMVVLVPSFNPPDYLLFGVLTVLLVLMGTDNLMDSRKKVGVIFLVTASVTCLTALKEVIVH